MRVLAFIIGVVMAAAGGAGAYALQRAVGPGDRSGEFGFGQEATRPAGGGSVFDARNAQKIVDGLRREVGPEARIGSFRLEPDGADATVVGTDRQRSVELDASGRVGPDSSYSAPTGPRAAVRITRLDAKGIERAVRSAREQSGDAAARVTSVSLDVQSRSWRIDLDRGDATSFEANLDGRGVRLSGEPNPRGLGGDPDSLLRPAMLEKMLQDAMRQAQGAKVAESLTVRPGSGVIRFARGSRALTLSYGFEAQLTNRSLVPGATGMVESVRLDQVPRDIVSRLLRTARRAYPKKRLADVDYFTSSVAPTTGGLGWVIYFTADSSGETKHVVTSADGRRLLYPTSP